MPTAEIPQGVQRSMYEEAMAHPSRGAKKIFVSTYSAKITIKGKVKYLGTFDSAKSAHHAYMQEAKLSGIKVKNDGISPNSQSGYTGVIVTTYERREPRSWIDPRVFKEKGGIRVEPHQEPNRCHPNPNIANENRCARNDNQSGLKGAMKTGTGKWMSRIWTGVCYKYLGYFHSAEDAHEAYIKAARGGFYRNGQILPQHKDHAFVYIVRYDEKYYKIGIAKDPIERLATIATSLPLPPELLLSMYSEDAYLIERKLHRQFQSKRLNGEWFLLEKEDMDFISELADSLHSQ